MRALTLAAALALLACPAAALDPAPHDRLLETLPSGDSALVLRYIDPAIAGLRYDDVADTLDALCARDGLPAWAAADPRPGEIVIVLMDRPVPRGQPDPEATQSISAYLPEDEGARCAWY